MISLKNVDYEDVYMYHTHIYFDDENQRFAPCANVEDGFIIRMRFDDLGDVVIDTSGGLDFEMVYGEVEIYYSR